MASAKETPLPDPGPARELFPPGHGPAGQPPLPGHGWAAQPAIQVDHVYFAYPEDEEAGGGDPAGFSTVQGVGSATGAVSAAGAATTGAAAETGSAAAVADPADPAATGAAESAAPEAGEAWVLKDLSFQVMSGEFVALLGANGSGKSSLARLLNAQYLPQEGTIKIFGLDSRDEDQVWQLRSACGLVFQNPENQMVSSFIEEDVAFGPENLGIPQPELRERVDWALKAVDMYDLRKREIHELSGGQKQRVAIAGILAMKPSCLVLDEPTAMLDPQGRQKILQTLLRLNREEGMTIVLITHDMEEASLADRLLVLDQGALALEGPREAVFAQEEALEALGLALPQVSQLARSLRQAGLDLAPGLVTLEDLLEALDALTV